MTYKVSSGTLSLYSLYSLKFTDGEINCLGVFSGCVGDCFFPDDISGLRRHKNVKFGTKVASNTSMMRTLRFLEENFLIVAKFENAKNRPQNANFTKKNTDAVAPRIRRNMQRIPYECILHTRHVYAETAYTIRVHSPHATSDNAQH